MVKKRAAGIRRHLSFKVSDSTPKFFYVIVNVPRNTISNFRTFFTRCAISILARKNRNAVALSFAKRMMCGCTQPSLQTSCNEWWLLCNHRVQFWTQKKHKSQKALLVAFDLRSLSPKRFFRFAIIIHYRSSSLRFPPTHNLFRFPLAHNHWTSTVTNTLFWSTLLFSFWIYIY